MNPQDLRKKLHGVISFPVTPFKEDLSLDLPGLRKNIRAILKHPVCAIVAPGGTGEFFSLTPAEHLQVLEAALEEVGGRVPVLAGAGFNRAAAIELAKRSEKAGAAGILAFPPYFPGADEEGLTEYYQAIGHATPLGMLIYSRDWVNPGPAGVERIAAAVETLIAWKDGQGDLRRYQMIMERVGERLHWIGGVGDDLVPGYYSLGIRTFTSSIANVSSKMAVQLHELASAGDRETLPDLMRDYVTPLYEFRARRKGYEITVMKEMMNLLGMPAGPVRPPLPRLRPQERKELEVMVEKWRPVL